MTPTTHAALSRLYAAEARELRREPCRCGEIGCRDMLRQAVTRADIGEARRFEAMAAEAALRAHGSIAAAARELRCSRTTMRSVLAKTPDLETMLRERRLVMDAEKRRMRRAGRAYLAAVARWMLRDVRAMTRDDVVYWAKAARKAGK